MFNFQHSIKQKIIRKIYQSEEIENTGENTREDSYRKEIKRKYI